MNVRKPIALMSLLALAAPAWEAVAQAPPPAAPPIATVGPRRVERDDFERRAADAVQKFGARSPGEVPAELKDVLRRQMLESLIRLQLLVLEAARQGITVPQADAEAELKKESFFNPGGKFDPNRYVAIRTTQPARFEIAVREIQEQLAARKLDAQLREKFAPADAELHAGAERAVRHASIEALSLRRGDFTGRAPEPRELDVLDYYRGHLAQWQRPERASLSVAFVNEPGLTDPARRDPATLAAWTRSMRRKADSLLAEVRAGRTLEQVTKDLGGLHAATVQPDNFPGYWKGDAAASAAVFRQQPGALLEPVQGADGWLLARVDDVTPAQAAPLREVAREIRSRLRADQRAHHDEYELRALFASVRDSLSGPAWRIRWGAADTGSIATPEPTADDLDRYYRGHLADYSSYDARTATIVAQPLAQVRDDVRRRWQHDRRLELARVAADAVYRAWSAGRRDADDEALLHVRESAPTPRGGDVDTSDAAHALSDTLWDRGDPQGAGLAPYARGFLVWQVTGRVDRWTPTFEQSRPQLMALLAQRREAADEAGARALWQRDPMQFSNGDVIYYSRLVVMPEDILQVHLTRAQVERWHRQNIDKYSAPELVHARHILISPQGSSAAADRAARARADSILARLQAGDDFGELARRFSDDPATKDKGGDLGTFGRGTMLQNFENASFALKPGEYAPSPVRTEVGYHVIQCIEHVPAFVQPLVLVYTNVAADLALSVADSLARLTADSLAHALRTPAEAKQVALRHGFRIASYQQPLGQREINTNLRPYSEELTRMKTGQLMHHEYHLKGQGYWVTWVDSLTPPTRPTWEEARDRALAAYRATAGERAMLAKRAELDSLFAAGWSLDSLGTLWGGLERVNDLAVGPGLSQVGGGAAIDSLVFGGPGGHPALQAGQVSGWVSYAGGLARVRLASVQEPGREQLDARIEEMRQAAIERRMAAYFDGLKKRWPVKILDARLRETSVPEPPATP